MFVRNHSSSNFWSETISTCALLSLVLVSFYSKICTYMQDLWFSFSILPSSTSNHMFLQSLHQVSSFHSPHWPLVYKIHWPVLSPHLLWPISSIWHDWILSHLQNLLSQGFWEHTRSWACVYAIGSLFLVCLPGISISKFWNSLEVSSWKS